MAQKKRVTSFIPLLLLLFLLSRADAYGEGIFDMQPLASKSTAPVVSFVDSSLHCSRLHSTLPTVAVHVDGTGLGHEPLCVTLRLRSSAEAAWWFMIPPPASGDVVVRRCGTPSTPSSLTIRFNNVSLPRGFTRLSATLDLGPSSTTPVPSAAHALVWVEDPGGTTWSDMATRLTASSAAVRSFGEEENTVMRDMIEKNNNRYTVQNPALVLAESGGARLRDLLDPELSAALQDGSPRALWNVIRGTDHTTRCDGDGGLNASSVPPACRKGVYTVPIFSPKARRMLRDELLHAKFESPVGPDLTIPNNNNRARTPRTSVVLDEIGLGGLARALAREVLAPLSQLVHPGWMPSFYDSYHAFSIHVGKGDGAWDFHKEASSDEAAAAAAAARTTPNGEGDELVHHKDVGDKLPRHIDICEASLNICLGNADPSILGSAVHFAEVSGTGKKEAMDQEQAVPHVPGRGFLNLCQHFHGTDALKRGTRHTVVVRSLSSHFRRAPAELFHQECMSGGAAGGGDGAAPFMSMAGLGSSASSRLEL